MAHPQLGDLLVSSGVISQEQLGQALARQKETKKRLGEELIGDGIITEQQLIDTLRLQLGIEFVDLSAVEPDPQLVDVLPRNIAKKYGVTPVRLHGNTLYLAMSDPLNFMAQEEVRAATHRRVVPMITTADGIERANASLYGGEGAQRAIRDMRREAPDTQQGSTADAVVELNETAAPTVRLVNSIIERAAAENASDIHLDPCADCIRVRMRVDGVMCPVMSFIATCLFMHPGNQIIALWLQKTVQNFPMALCWQMLYCGPLARAIFRLVFRRGEKQAA